MTVPAHAARTARPTPRPGWTDEHFAKVASVAYTVAGLVFPPNRHASAEAAMRRVMTAQQLATPAALLHAIERPGEPRDALLAELTVGESYFFREAAALGVLEREIVDGRPDTDPIRIWSAGCATGEEPYTLAMLLRELGSRHTAQILGTDISRPRLDAARRGRYTQWSLRGVSPERITRWFQQRGKHFMVDERVRESVRFDVLNLVSDEYPSTTNGTSDQDLILCRNVLIYFDLPTVAQIATQLLRALRPGGWLLLGASDPPLGDLVECRTFMTPSGAVYQRVDGALRVGSSLASWPRAPFEPTDVVEFVGDAAATDVIDAPVAGDPHALSSPVLPSRPLAGVPGLDEHPILAAEHDGRPSAAADAYRRGEYRVAADQAQRELARGEDDPSLWVTWIRALANSGDLARAGEVTAASLDRHRLVPELHYLHGMLLLEAGLVAEGARAARRALYLDRCFVIGHMLLGDALSRLGDVTGARRAFGNAVRLLARATDAAAVPAADGVSAPRLQQIAADRLRALGDGT